MGWLLLVSPPPGLPPSGETPNAPVIALTSPISDTSPQFLIYGEWQNGDDLQFERRLYDPDDDWSGATVSNHTVTSGQIAGAAIELSLSPLVPGNYQYRAKYAHVGGSYGDYSPLETGEINTDLRFNFMGQISWAGDGGSTTKTASAQIGAAYSTRRVFLFGMLTDNGGSNTIADITFNGTSATVTQAGTPGYNLHWMATAIVDTGNAIDLELIYNSGAFETGTALLYVVDDTTLDSPTPIDIVHVNPSGATSATLNIDTEAVGSCVFLGAITGAITDGNPTITSSDDAFTIDYVSTLAGLGGHVNGTENRTAEIVVGWSPALDAYFTAWSFK